MSKVFGKIPSGERLKRIEQSPNYKHGAFRNLSPTPVMAEDSSFWKALVAYMNKPKTTTPPSPIPTIKTDLQKPISDKPSIVWFGHSSYFIQINGLNILVDPLMGKNAAPVSFMVKAYNGTTIYSPDDFPAIDLLIITHDHYDHLDYNTMSKIKPKIKTIATALGVGAHLEYWGFDKNIIHEFDWWDSEKILPGVQLTAAPSRHFSGRGVSRGKTLWTSFALKTGDYNLYLGGDSGYDKHFKEIGEKLGPFDIAILETGQYNINWKDIHMMPEDAVQAAVDLKAKWMLPVHWSKFTLSLHPWNEPVQRVLTKAKEMNVKVTTPRIGEPVILDIHYPNAVWWEL